jgi:hypothetical protein
MKRILMAYLAFVLGACAVLAATPEVAAAIKTIQSVAGDPGKLKLFCALNDALQTAGEKEDPVIEKQLEGIIKQLGSEFEAAWDLGNELDEDSPDGMEFFEAVDALADKCK